MQRRFTEEQITRMLQEAAVVGNVREVCRQHNITEQTFYMTENVRKTNDIERFNNSLGQRVAHLAREPMSLSKKLANHIGAIEFFICCGNLGQAAA